MGGTKLSSTLPNFTGRVLDHGRYHIIRFLGSGAYGAVYRAVDLKASATNDPSPHRAIKILRKTGLSKSQARAVQREVRLHYSMTAHPNVVTMHRVFEDLEYVYIVLEYHHGGTLFNKVCRECVYWKNDELLKKVFLQIVDAVFACHRNHVFHRDLKPENILISEDGSIPYLADFGLATDERFSTTFGCGSSLFMSPECIGIDRGRVAYSTSHSDLWSLGIILINMITARSPWSKAILANHNYSNFLSRPNMLREMLPISEGAASIIISLLNSSPHERITLSSLREAIINLDTFFMCDEEIALSGETVRAVAGTFAHKVRRLANEESKPDVSPCMVRTKFRNKRMGSKGKFGECVYTPPPGTYQFPVPVQATPDVKVAEVQETKAKSGSSTEESEGPVTPETRPVDAPIVVSSLEGGLNGGAEVVKTPQKAGPLGVLNAIISSLIVSS